MCGIFGVVASSSTQLGGAEITKWVETLFLLSESRGKEASGFVLLHDSGRKTCRKPISAKKLVSSGEVGKLFSSTDVDIKKTFCFIGHCRLVTNGSHLVEANNQPVSNGDHVAVHNGIIVNHREIWEDEIDGELPESEVDSEVLVAFANQNPSELNLEKLFSKIEGSASVAMTNSSETLDVATNTGSIYYVTNSNGFFVFASEEIILDKIKTKFSSKKKNDWSDVRQLGAGCGLKISSISDKIEIESYSLRYPKSRKCQKSRELIPINSTLRYSKYEPKNLPDLKRCTKCVLPETMPFISFDQDGVCNFCHSYKKMEIKPEIELEKYVEKIKKESTSTHDCIVTFSGGRDSSYALHLLKTKYDLNPVAFTYDWGMVTDLARRNQARVCGQLGVEHIILSADISKKRDNIRKNVKAWLKKPELGMIPLFMAGDKEFFLHFNRIRKQMNIESVALSINPLERTNFKIGFCGTKQKGIAPYSSGIEIASYYLRNYLTNPAYINSSVFDTMKAYYSSFFAPKDYFMPYDYIRWDEDIVNEALLGEYSWEVSPDSISTWRIGDGTASFYNYIYFRIVGFSENDTLRSNQIREGMISRSNALYLLDKENMPRLDSIKEYLDLINIDYKSTLEIINKVPRRYS